MARIEDLAPIGDCRSAALIDRDGAIVWLCLPRLDSPACFAALLGRAENGFWRIAPESPYRANRRYRDDTLVLETIFRTEDGEAAIVDFMPVGLSRGAPDASPHAVRIVEGRGGTVPFRCDLTVRFDYGRTSPRTEPFPGGFHAVSGSDRLTFRSIVPFDPGTFTVRAGERICFTLSHARAGAGPPAAPDPLAALAATEAHWRSWSDRTTYAGRWRDPVRRSLLTLKALCHAPTGAMAAAATTSLPERIGGTRNWDYRYCWLRDSSLAALALWRTGHRREARDWAGWLSRATAGPPEGLLVLYGLGGERRNVERELPWLPGYEGSAPVRVGNGAASHRQLDVFGETELALCEIAPTADWPARRARMEYLETIWREPDESIWEVRGGRRQFVFSKAMAWAAFDRAIRTATAHGLPAPLDRWRAARRAAFDLVCQRGFNPALGAFVQTLDGTTLDASLLLLPLIGFLPANDPRIAGTVAAIGRDLTVDGFVRRYRTDESEDGLPPGEGAFLACGFWYAANLALQGRRGDAEALFERLLGLCNDVGQLSEEYDPAAGRMVGNFPQGFSHLALVEAALVLDGTGPSL